MMSRKYIWVILMVLLSQKSKAQLFYTPWEYGVMAGGSQYFGDLNDNYGFSYVQPAGFAFVRYHMNPYISVRAQLGYTKVGYDDAFTNNPFNKKRNLSFRSNIMELSVQAEFNFFRYVTGEEGHRFTPYLTGGLGAFIFNPTTTYNGVEYHLHDLGTEGQNAGIGKKYSTVSACFPVGAGIKYWIRPGINFGVEISDRLTLTDYMDDVSTTYAGASQFAPGSPAQLLQDRSLEADAGGTAIGKAGKQRGNAATKDQYGMLQLSLSIQFRTYRCPGYLMENYYFRP